MFSAIRASARLYSPLVAARKPSRNPLRLCTPFRISARGFADDTKPPKPKASTPLRRAASASLTIRSNPTPTRSTIQPVFTLTTAERFILPRLRAHLPASAHVLQEAWWVPKWSANGKDGEVFIFGNGSIVCWGLGEAEAHQFAAEVLAKSNAEVRRLADPETEDLEFVTDPTECVPCLMVWFRWD